MTAKNFAGQVQKRYLPRFLSYDFTEAEHLAVIVLFRFRCVLGVMVFVEKLDYLKAAAVDVKVNVALFKIRRNCFPFLHLRIHSLDFLSCGAADAFAVNRGRDK